MAKYLDKSGVTYLWNKIKGLFTDQSLNTKNKTYAGAINEINTKVGNLTGAFLWKGKFDTLPAVTNYEAGNVVGVGKKEYVLTVTEGTKTWEEFGDEGSYLLKTAAEETYLKKTAGEVKTANLADNAVTSTKLAKGARKPIILTPDTTEVDEETYQKLLSDGVDVVFKTSTESTNLCTLTYKIDRGSALKLYFTCFSMEGEYILDVYLYAYEVSITKASPHTCSITENVNNSLDIFLDSAGYLNKFYLNQVLQEIDLSGTDADRKAKLDQFETDWKALTGADDLTGARFVGNLNTTDGGLSTILTWNADSSQYEGIGFDDVAVGYKIKVNNASGSLTITPLFSHLEAITIYTDNTPEHMQANLANIAAYEANLQALGVDTTKSPMIPCGFQNLSRGWITKSSTASGEEGHLYVGIARDENGAPYTYFISVNPTGKYSKYDAINSGDINNNFELGVVGVQANAKSLEAITIRTGNTPEDKAANVAAIKAYVDNLTALGVDTTKGYMIPVKPDNGYHGFIMGTDADGGHTGVIKLRTNSYEGGWIFIDNIGTYRYLECLTLGRRYTNLTTTAKEIIPAIKEVNALAKSKQDALTSGTNIKTVNGQSLLGSGDITISGGGSGDVTKAGNNIFTGDNTFTKFVHFSRGIELTNANDDVHYYLDLDSNTNKFRISDDSDMDVEVTGVDTPTQDNSAANKKYVDDKVAAAGGGSAPVLVDIDDISGSAGDSVPVDVFNKIANAASARTPIFGYSRIVNVTKTAYEIIPLYVKNVSTPDTNGSLSIQFIAENAYNSVGIRKRSDTECSILISSSRPFALDTSVDKSSTRGIQSSAVWTEIHSEPMTVNTATSGVTTLSSTDKHKILCYADSGTQQYNLPSSPVDGETFLFLKVKSGHTITIQSGTGNENIYNCSSGNSVVSKTIGTSTRRKITVTYSSTVGKWFLMADDFIS